jgi:hypothetical protein
MLTVVPGSMIDMAEREPEGHMDPAGAKHRVTVTDLLHRVVQHRMKAGQHVTRTPYQPSHTINQSSKNQ